MTRPFDHLPYTCPVCLAMAERRGREMAEQRRLWGGEGRRCGVCGFWDGHAPDCDKCASVLRAANLLITDGTNRAVIPTD